MDIYLPIAGVAINVFALLGIGATIGFLAGVFGIGGGFLMIPLLIFVGVPVPIAVASHADQVLGTSLSGLLGHWRRGNVDFTMGGIMLPGGLAGSAFGVWLFTLLQQFGQINLAVSLLFVLLLSGVGALMAIESIRTLLLQRRPAGVRHKLHQHTWLHGLPLKMRFRRSKLYISALLPLGLGALIGMVSGILGIGSGFLLVPAMIYVLGMPTRLVPGTSLLQIIFVTASVTFLQAYTNHTVDIVLVIMLLLGSVLGAQIGARFGARLRGAQLRFLLALLLLAVAAKLLFDLTVLPEQLFSVIEVSG
ncbi:MAG TPA: sulfite exporter TauE/SafE family protein [Stellaceae bacterium]|nr:sulfite exporter TauE/SafE family protein [Stellaceae bacterium]